MPRSSGVYSKPAGTTAVDGQVISPTSFNTLVDDLVSDANAARPISAGGTGATTASAARAAIGVGDPGGIQEVWLSADGFTARLTNGAERYQTELASNDVMVSGYAFDPDTTEGIQIRLALPKSWDESTITYTAYWLAASGTGDVVWSLRGVAVSNDDALDASFGTAGTVTDTLIAANDLHVSPESGDVTLGGSPAAQDLLVVEVERDADAAGDTLTTDAILVGVKMFITTTANNDA